MEFAPGEIDARPFRELAVPPSVRVPGWLGVLFGAAAATGPVVGLLDRRAPLARRVVRSTLVGSTAVYAVSALLDLVEHLRLEKGATGRLLSCEIVPRTETAVHAALIATNLSVLGLVRPLRRPMGLREGWILLAPVVFLALGWADELVYHRKRAPRRENVIHAVEHLAEGVMWTALYATRLVSWKR